MVTVRVIIKGLLLGLSLGLGLGLNSQFLFFLNFLIL